MLKSDTVVWRSLPYVRLSKTLSLETRSPKFQPFHGLSSLLYPRRQISRQMVFTSPVLTSWESYRVCKIGCPVGREGGFWASHIFPRIVAFCMCSGVLACECGVGVRHWKSKQQLSVFKGASSMICEWREDHLLVLLFTKPYAALNTRKILC